MRTASASVLDLVQKIDRGDIRLPEIQRGYVWKASQVAGLIDSLYKGYPSGSLLLWETDEEVTERSVNIEGPNRPPNTRPQYLLDGQQRLTSLHRVFIGHEQTKLRFHLGNERFQMASGSTERDMRWVPVGDLLRDEIDLYDFVGAIGERHPELDRSVAFRHLEKVKRIASYDYHLEILDGLLYQEVTEIFVRVNSRGKALKSTDLALAMLSARWSGTIRRMEELAGKLANEGFRHLDLTFLVRLLAGLADRSTSLAGLQRATIDELEDAWSRVLRGLDHLLPILRNNVGIDSSALVTSITALIPMAAYLGSRDDEAIPAEAVNGLVYWMFAANLNLRYSAGKETRLNEDLAAVRSDQPLEALFRNQNLLGERLTITEDALVGRGVASPYFLLSYLATKRRHAKDWFFGVDIGPGLEGGMKLEYHHIHPQARLRHEFAKAEINDIANLVFISGKANRKISSRSPSRYFREVGNEDLEAHLVPTDAELLATENYPDFLKRRRSMLARAMTDLLDSFRPRLAGVAAQVATDPHESDRVALDLWISDGRTGDEDILDFTARRGDREWHAEVPFADLERYLRDIENGLGAEIEVAGRTFSWGPDDDEIALGVGPFRLTGELADWTGILDREVADARPIEERPARQLTEWRGEDATNSFPVLDTE